MTVDYIGRILHLHLLILRYLSEFVFYCCDNDIAQQQFGDIRFIYLIITVHALREHSTEVEEETLEECWLLVCSVCFLQTPRIACPGVAHPPMSWVPLHHESKTECPAGFAYRQYDGGN